MRLTSIILEGFKRQNATVPLSGKDIFVGPNGSGKSARPQAVALAILGYVPALRGKRPQDIARLSSDDNFAVGVTTDSFGAIRTFRRLSKMKRDGSMEVTISQDITVSPSRGEETVTQAEARIKAELGDLPIMLDFGRFLEMSDADRRAFFFGLAGVNGQAWTKERVGEHLRAELLTDALQENNPDAYAVQAKMIEEALEEWRDGMDAEAGVQAMHEWAKAQQKHWNAEKRKATGAVQKLAELKNQLAETDRGIAENRAELERLQEELASVREQLARQEEAKAVYQERIEEIKRLRERVHRLSRPTWETTEGVKSPSELRAKISELEACIAEYDISADLQRIQEQVDAVVAELDAVDKEIAEAQRRRDTARVKADQYRHWIKQASERGGLCVISPNISCPKDFTPFLEWARGEAERLEGEVGRASSQLSTLTAKREELRRRRLALDTEKAQVYGKADEVRRRNDEIRDQIRDLRSELERTEANEARRSDDLSEAQAELARLEAKPAPAVADTTLLEMQRNGLVSQIEALKAKIEEQEKARTTIANMQASMIDSTTAEYHHAASKYLAEALGPKGLQGKMLSGALGPIQDAVTANLQAMELPYEFFFETQSPTGQEVFRFGWINEDGHKVDFEALSTGQQMMLLAALLVAVLERANPPCKILAIDNVEALDETNWQRVLAGLDKLSGKIDNILLAGARSLDVDPDGWTVHRLGVEAGVAV